jgi:hypothetical protein
MALTLETNHTDSITLDEYVAWMKAKVEFSDRDSVLASAPMLRALANNRTFFSDYLANELRDFATFQLGNAYTAPSFLLAVEPEFIVRVNIWEPPAGGVNHDQVFSYHLLHDHNFSFMTVGYYGAGYETALYEYDGSRVRGDVGELADLSYLGKTSLSPGKVMFYRASRDVHRQEYPRETSISVNLLLLERNTSLIDQYEFDARDGRILRTIEGSNTTRIGLCELARTLRDVSSLGALERIARTHPHHTVRSSAIRAIVGIDREEGLRVARSLANSGEAEARRIGDAVLETHS